MNASSDAVPVDAALAALADPLRRRTIELLARRPHRAGDLAGALGVTPPTMSKHLRILRQRGLVTDTQPSFDTRVRVYKLRQEPFSDLRRWLEDTELGWTEQLEAGSAHSAPIQVVDAGVVIGGPVSTASFGSEHLNSML
jgi:DNA-binding transcriptional ArsR family regulator